MLRQSRNVSTGSQITIQWDMPPPEITLGSTCVLFCTITSIISPSREREGRCGWRETGTLERSERGKLSDRQAYRSAGNSPTYSHTYMFNCIYTGKHTGKQVGSPSGIHGFI